jgi:hypothetical protein
MLTTLTLGSQSTKAESGSPAWRGSPVRVRIDGREDHHVGLVAPPPRGN